MERNELRAVKGIPIGMINVKDGNEIIFSTAFNVKRNGKDDAIPTKNSVASGEGKQKLNWYLTRYSKAALSVKFKPQR